MLHLTAALVKAGRQWRQKKKKSSSWCDDELKSSLGHFVSVWIPYSIFMSCHGLLNINSVSHRVHSHKLSFRRPSDPAWPAFIIHSGPCAFLSSRSFPYSNMMKPLLKCQYSAPYPQLAACHFISTLKLTTSHRLEVHVLPGATLSRRRKGTCAAPRLVEIV